MCFDQVYRRWVDVGICVGAFEHVYLRIWVRGGQAVGMPVGVGGRSFDDRQDFITVCHRVRDPFEHDKACCFGAHDAVSVVRKCVNRPGRRDDAQFRKHQ